MYKKCIISNHIGVHGSSINMLDFHQYMKNFENQDMIFLCSNIDWNQKVLKKSYRKYKIK